MGINPINHSGFESVKSVRLTRGSNSLSLSLTSHASAKCAVDQRLGDVCSLERRSCRSVCSTIQTVLSIDVLHYMDRRILASFDLAFLSLVLIKEKR